MDPATGSPSGRWQKWRLDENGGTLSLPEGLNGDSAFPRGVAVDFTATEPVVGDKTSRDGDPLPPSPRVFVYDNYGCISEFYFVNIQHNTHGDFSGTLCSFLVTIVRVKNTHAATSTQSLAWTRRRTGIRSCLRISVYQQRWCVYAGLIR